MPNILLAYSQDSVS